MRVRSSWRALRRLEIALVAIGLALLAGFGWLKFEERYYQARYAAALNEALAVQAEEDERGEPLLETSAEARPQPAHLERQQAAPAAPQPPANLYGRLSSPDIGLEVAVADGLDARTLRRAAGRLPREGRNIVIAAHRDSFFRPLRDVQAGDRFLLEPLEGEARRYEVVSLKVVEPDAVDAMAETEVDSLTLITCFPFHWVGPAPRRLIVRAEAL